MLHRATATQIDEGYKDLKLISEVLMRCNVCKVGRIVAFDSASCSCSVQILEKKRLENGFTDYPLLKNVPLVIDGTVNSSLTHGDPAGTDCLIVFNDAEIDKWWVTGQSYETNMERMHDLSDGFCLMRPISKGAGFIYDVMNTVLARGNNKVVLSDASASLQANTTQVNLDTMVEIKNATQSLAVLMQTFLTACENIQTGPDNAPVSLTTASKQQFTTLKTHFMELLK